MSLAIVTKEIWLFQSLTSFRLLIGPDYWSLQIKGNISFLIIKVHSTHISFGRFVFDL
jgi:hypothetical protein